MAGETGLSGIIITIMVLEMKVPHGSRLDDLAPLLPVFLSYVLSFVYVGIYWNNHLSHPLISRDSSERFEDQGLGWHPHSLRLGQYSSRSREIEWQRGDNAGDEWACRDLPSPVGTADSSPGLQSWDLVGKQAIAAAGSCVHVTDAASLDPLV